MLIASESKAWLVNECSGGAFLPSQAICDRLQDWGLLQKCGISLGPIPGCKSSTGMSIDHPAIVDEDHMADIYGRMSFSLISNALQSALQYMEGWPGKAMRLLTEGLVERTIDEIMRAEDVYEEHVKNSTLTLWKRAASRSYFEYDMFVRKVGEKK